MNLINMIKSMLSKLEPSIQEKFVTTYHDKLLRNSSLNEEENKVEAWSKLHRLTEIPEFTDDNLIELVNIYLESPTLDDAEANFRKYIDTIVPDCDYDWKSKDYESTQEFKQHKYAQDVRWFLGDVSTAVKLDKEWVKKNGKKHTDEEAAKIATEKVMELCFDWHLQDNGALDEQQSFMMSAIATTFGNDAKDKISEDSKRKAYKLCYEFFFRYLKYKEAYDNYDLAHVNDYRNWLRKNLPSSDPERFNWDYIHGELDCDYDPSWPWILIFENAGIPENTIRLICPWKTHISIRTLDNTVLYRTYQNCEYL